MFTRILLFIIDKVTTFITTYTAILVLKSHIKVPTVLLIIFCLTLFGITSIFL